MSRRVINQQESPPGYWRFPSPLDGKIIGPFPARVELMNELRKHYASNSILAPANLDAEVDDWMCNQLHPSLCEDADTGGKALPQPKKNKGLVAQFNSVVAGTKTIAEWFVQARIMGKRELVSIEQATERGLVCINQCTPPANPVGHHVPIGRCAPCVLGSYTKAVEIVVGARTLPIDDQLQACNVCGCGLRAKVQIPVDILRKHMAPEHLAQFPSFCWLVTEPK